MQQFVFHLRICNSTNVLNIWSQNGNFENYTDWTFFTLIRDPVERLIASYLDKCL